jgi:hypothetical protein
LVVKALMNEQANEKKVGIPEPIKLLLAEF